MKRMFFVITILLLCLAAYAGGVAEKVTPSPAPAKNLAAGEKIVGEAVIPLLAPTQEPAAGEKLFARACAACHGQDLTQSELVATSTNQELVEFIKVGGVPDGPRVMPPRGGSPWLTDENLVDLAVYLRSSQK